MPIEVTMPRLSDTMQQGTVVKWQVKEGQKIKSGDVIADIETDKATMELQSFDDGVVAHLAAAEGQSVPVGTVIMLLAAAGEDGAAIKATGAVSARAGAAQRVGAGGGGAPTATASTGTALAEPKATAGSSAGDEDRVFASPLARKIAAESKLDLSAVQGTGPSGRIIRKDVEAALTSPARPVGAGAPPATAGSPQRGTAAEASGAMPSPLPPINATLTARTVALSNMRRTIARRLVESKTTIPHYQVTVEVDLDPLIALRTQLNEQLASQGVKLSVNDFLVRACAIAMHQHPYVNSRLSGTAGNESIDLLADVNIGIAIALDESRGGGLLVATLRNADRMGLRQVSTLSKQLAEKARTKGLTPEEMADSTFTISNLGMFGVDHFNAIINPPNVAILAVGAGIEKPVVKDGQIVVGHRMAMTMSSDHRVVDGAMAAAYLNTLRGLLEKPATLLV